MSEPGGIVGAADEVERLRERVAELESRQVTCECDPLLAAKDRCSGTTARCRAGVVAALKRLEGKASKPKVARVGVLITVGTVGTYVPTDDDGGRGAMDCGAVVTRVKQRVAGEVVDAVGEVCSGDYRDDIAVDLRLSDGRELLGVPAKLGRGSDAPYWCKPVITSMRVSMRRGRS